MTDILPHRPPFLFIDEIVSATDTFILAKRKIRADEFFFQGHYPGNPVLPGVLLCEAMFQAGAALLALKLPEMPEGIPAVTRVNNVKFKKLVRPGDELQIEAQFLEKIANAYLFKGKIRVGETIAAACDFTCTVVDEKDKL
ncbi:MAG: 3-hydroxyacyl-ACP dehydratase FabZ [Candidatus Wallbacteria bacterium]|nr:3-hydroxyacyl-ACP dehydratase FabZ [Candidatus Wallbacteria bacterium]